MVIDKKLDFNAIQFDNFLDKILQIWTSLFLEEKK